MRWVNDQYNWDDTFEDETTFTQIQLIHCKYCCEQVVLYILDIYEEKYLDLECGTHRTISLVVYLIFILYENGIWNMFLGEVGTRYKPN